MIDPNDPTARAWAAGIIDADGCITIRRFRRADGTYYALHVLVSQVGPPGDPDATPLVIAELSRFGGAVQNRADSRVGRRRLYHWTIATRQAEAFLRAIRPYMVGKADQADVALAYREQAVGGGGPNVAGRAIAEVAYARLRAMKNYTNREGERHDQDAANV